MKARCVRFGKVSELLSRIEHVSIFPTSYLPNYLDETRFIVDLNFLILVKMPWTVVCEGNKTIDLLSRNSIFSPECFLNDNKKFNEWTKAAETLRSEIAQITVTFSGLQRTQNSSIRKRPKDILVFFSNSEKSFSLHAQVNGKCLDSSHSPLKRHCSTKWIEDHDAVYVFKEFYPAVIGFLDQLSELRDGKVLARAMLYVKATTTAGFLVSVEVINATLNLIKPVAKKLQGTKKLL